MSYRINKDPIQIRDTTSPIPSYIELQKERSCTSKLFNSSPTNIITNKVDEFIKKTFAHHPNKKVDRSHP